jgi:hypothetical protein
MKVAQARSLADCANAATIYQRALAQVTQTALFFV